MDGHGVDLEAAVRSAQELEEELTRYVPDWDRVESLFAALREALHPSAGV